MSGVLGGSRARALVAGFALLLISTGCGGDTGGGSAASSDATPESSGSAAAGGPDTAPASSAAGQAGESGAYDRASFVLCPVIEEHKEELASLVGFAADPDRSVQTFASECDIHGESGSFVKVELAPAIESSIPMRASGYDDPSAPAAELGEGAVFIDASVQPHVIFPMGNLIIDVGAEALETPGRGTMITLARRVRELLTGANS